MYTQKQMEQIIAKSLLHNLPKIENRDICTYQSSDYLFIKIK